MLLNALIRILSLIAKMPLAQQHTGGIFIKLT